MSFWQTAFNPNAFNNDAFQVQRSTAIIAVGVQEELEKELEREKRLKEKKKLEAKRKIDAIPPKERSSFNLDLKSNLQALSDINLLKSQISQLKEEETKKKLKQWEEEEMLVLQLLLGDE